MGNANAEKSTPQQYECSRSAIDQAEVNAQVSDLMGHIEHAPAKGLKVVDVHVVLLKALARREVEVARHFVHQQESVPGGDVLGRHQS